METAGKIDAEVVLWLNQWAGRSAFLDGMAEVVASDYFIPAFIGLCLVAAWFGARDARRRDSQQRAVLVALATVGFAGLVVLILNQHYFRPRPYVELELTLLMYPPTDSSFPAHPAAVAFAMASGMWQGSRKIGLFLYGLAALWGLSRIYAGVFYPSDIAAGALIAIGMSYLVAMGYRLIEPVPTLVLRAARALHLA